MLMAMEKVIYYSSLMKRTWTMIVSQTTEISVHHCIPQRYRNVKLAVFVWKTIVRTLSPFAQNPKKQARPHFEMYKNQQMFLV